MNKKKTPQKTKALFKNLRETETCTKRNSKDLKQTTKKSMKKSSIKKKS